MYKICKIYGYKDINIKYNIMLNCFLCAFIFSNILNSIYSFPIKLFNEINYKNNNFSIPIKKNVVPHRYKNLHFGEFLDLNYDFGQKTQISDFNQIPYCLYDKPNNTNLSNLICGLKHKTFIYIRLPPL
jgi:hypothetical protein